MADPTLALPPGANEATWGTFNKGGATAAQHHCQAAVTGKQLRLMALSISTEGEQEVTIENSGGTDLFGPVYIAADTQYLLPMSNYPWATTVAGEGISMVLGQATATTAHGIYCYI